MVCRPALRFLLHRHRTPWPCFTSPAAAPPPSFLPRVSLLPWPLPHRSLLWPPLPPLPLPPARQPTGRTATGRQCAGCRRFAASQSQSASPARACCQTPNPSQRAVGSWQRQTSCVFRGGNSRCDYSSSTSPRVVL